MHPEDRAVRLQQAQFKVLRLGARKKLFTLLVVEILVILEDEVGERPVEQPATSHAEHLHGGEVGLLDQPRLADGDIAHRGQIVEIEVARPCGFEIHLRPAQLLILHLQLDLMHAQR